MKRIGYSILFLLIACNIASAQFSKAELKVAGLSCSLCSKSTENQLKKLDFIDSIQQDLAHATFILYFKKDKTVDFYAIKKSVENAGFSVDMLKTTYKFDDFLLAANGQFTYQNAIFYCMNKSPQIVNGEVVLQIADKGFIPAKEYKKQAGQWAVHPNSDGNNPVYHVTFN